MDSDGFREGIDSVASESGFRGGIHRVDSESGRERASKRKLKKLGKSPSCFGSNIWGIKASRVKSSPIKCNQIQIMQNKPKLRKSKKSNQVKPS